MKYLLITLVLIVSLALVGVWGKAVELGTQCERITGPYLLVRTETPFYIMVGINPLTHFKTGGFGIRINSGPASFLFQYAKEVMQTQHFHSLFIQSKMEAWSVGVKLNNITVFLIDRGLGWNYIAVSYTEDF